ncbi:MFS transporter [Photobacterium sp. BZF1]|uniref:MFS transporter n=1 Tax=Photobacterium sp. BZF1 TaxID=1904457 RepID=UPI0016538C1A|nr:MFS transporter [Photobacterium sp. BZF1]MBC7003433.1 MFS transporter [Photobacterium sp. BZF1]
MSNQQEDAVLGKELSMPRRLAAFAAILMVYFFYCYNFMVDIFVRPTLVNEFGFTLQQASSIFAVMSLGTIPGTIVAGMCCSRFGKKRTLIAIAVLYALMTYLPLLSPDNYSLWRVARFITGFCLGGVFGTSIPLVAELFPQKYRGKLAAVCTSTFSVAMIFAGQLYGLLGDENWQLLVWSAIIPPLFGALLVYFLVPDDASYMKKLREEAAQENTKISYLEMYKGKYLWIGIAVIVLSGTNFVAYSGFSNNATTYLTTVLGMSAATAGTIFSIQGVGQLIGYNFWGFLSDRYGRKIPIIGMVAVSALIFVYSQLGIEDINTFYLVSFVLGMSFGFSGAWGAYYTELFPNKFRSLSAGISFNGGRLISTVGLPLVAGVSATAWGMQGIFTVVMFVALAGAALWFFLPETLSRDKPDSQPNKQIKTAN